MPCPTCDRTMQNLGVEGHPGRRVFWCQTCGTIKLDSGPGTFEDQQAPSWLRWLIEADARFTLEEFRRRYGLTFRKDGEK